MQMDLKDYPFYGPPSQLRGANRAASIEWILEHAPWLWEKPRIKVYVSMKTGTVYWFEGLHRIRMAKLDVDGFIPLEFRHG
jgi:hypothetical protein